MNDPPSTYPPVDPDRARRKRLLTLIHRANVLNRRIENNPDRNLSFDLAEHRALLWAIEELCKLYPRAAPGPHELPKVRTE